MSDLLKIDPSEFDVDEYTPVKTIQSAKSDVSKYTVHCTNMEEFDRTVEKAGDKLVFVFCYKKEPTFARLECENVVRTYAPRILVIKCKIEKGRASWVHKLCTKYKKTTKYMDGYCVFFLERGKLIWPHDKYRTPLIMDDEDELFSLFINDWFTLSTEQEKNISKIFQRHPDMFGFMHKRGSPNEFIPGSAGELLRRPLLIGFYICNGQMPECEKHFTPLLIDMYNLVKKKYTEYDLEIIYVSFDTSHMAYHKSTRAMPWLILPYEDHQVKTNICQCFNDETPPVLYVTNLKETFRFISCTDLPKNKQTLIKLFETWKKILVPKIRRYKPIKWPINKNVEQKQLIGNFQRHIKYLFPNLLCDAERKRFRSFDILRHTRIIGLLFIDNEGKSKKHHRINVHWAQQLAKFYAAIKKLDPNGFEMVYVPYTDTQADMFDFMHECQMNFYTLPYEEVEKYRALLAKTFEVFVLPKLLLVNVKLKKGGWMQALDPSDNYVHILKHPQHLYIKWLRDLDVVNLKDA